jgi:hypothetical protein
LQQCSLGKTKPLYSEMEGLINSPQGTPTLQRTYFCWVWGNAWIS